MERSKYFGDLAFAEDRSLLNNCGYKSVEIFVAYPAKAASGATNAGPTKENAPDAEKDLAQALRTNDGDEAGS